MTSITQDPALASVASKELEALFSRCKNYGHSPESVRAELRLLLRVTPQTAPARGPGHSQRVPPRPDLLQRALDCSRKFDGPGKQAAILTWLREAHGIGPGDVIEILGWPHRHEVRVEKVDITWKGLDAREIPNVLTDGFVWFEGPTRRESIGCSIRQSGAPLHFELVKVEPSFEFNQSFPAAAA